MSKHNLTTKDACRRLTVRREPYWQDLGDGCAIGFRRGPDSWIARWHNPADKRHLYKALKDATDFASARKLADEWWQTISGGAVATVQRGTVLEALRAYVRDKREHGRDADDIERRIGLTVEDKPLASIKLEQLTREAFKAWRTSLTKGRANRTTNREVRAIVAGLNWAVEHGGFSGNPLAWKVQPLADDIDDEADLAAVFLNPQQRAALIAAADADAALYLRGLEFTGARPGELAAATVTDFNEEAGTLTLRSRKGKSGKVRVRTFELSTAGVAFFAERCKDKLPLAPIFTEDRRKVAWTSHEWATAFRIAVSRTNDPPEGRPLKGKARIPVTASAYSFRHAFISEALQALDPITVARACGTSMSMIEKYYFKHLPSRVRDALDGLKANGTTGGAAK